MTTGTTRLTQANTGGPLLHVAFELDDRSWKLAFGTTVGRKPRLRRVKPRSRAKILEEIERTRRRFGLPEDVPVASCYEAGREGFWLHRWLKTEGIDNHVVDSSSIEVNRRARRAKADRLDAGKLLRMLIRYMAGEQDVWSIVRAPTAEAEDARHLHRELGTVKKERTRVTNRINGLLATQGVRLPVQRDFLEVLDAVELWDGSPLPSALRARLGRAFEHRTWLSHRIRTLEAERQEILESSEPPEIEQVRQLMQLKAIGENGAWVLVMEFFGWRTFNNRREVGALAGLAPSPYQSGDTNRSSGISKAGNRRVRRVMVQLAWAWLRYQPDSELTHWYRHKFGDNGGRMRKIGIVALARRLLIELWRFLETGAVPDGAVLTAA